MTTEQDTRDRYEELKSKGELVGRSLECSNGDDFETFSETYTSPDDINIRTITVTGKRYFGGDMLLESIGYEFYDRIARNEILR